MSRAVTPAAWTLILSAGLAAAAAVLTVFAPSGSLVAVHLPVPVLAAFIAATFLLSEQFSINVEFRREAHALTLAGVPLMIGALILSPAVFVLARVTGSLIVYAWQRVSAQKTMYNLAAYAFEAALDAALLHLLIKPMTEVDLWSGLVMVGVLAAVDQLMCLLVLVLIRLHTGPMTLGEVAAQVLTPAAVVSVIASTFGLGALMLVRQGSVGPAVVVVLAVVGSGGYRGYAKAQARHQSLALVHEFVTGGVGAQSVEGLAEELLSRIRQLLRAGTAELILHDVPTDNSRHDAAALVFTVGEDDQLKISHRVDASDWVRLRALTDEEPMLAARDTKDVALRRWLVTRGLRDAVLVGLPASSGLSGTLSVADRLGEATTFTAEDLTLLQTLTGHLSVALRNTRLLEKFAYDATHDSLTGLANRGHLAEQINGVLAEQAPHAAVLVLDLDRFKEVNDALGHDVGDRLLVAVAERLCGCVPADATVARLGGDEFAILIPRLDPAAGSAEALAQYVAAQLAQPIAFDEVTLTPEASIGVTVSTPHCRQTELLRQANTAMDDAKAKNMHTSVYHRDMDRGRVERLALVADLRNALASRPEEFVMYYQPKMNLATGAITSVEALIRWNHPTLGVVAPDNFIHLAETTGLITTLTPLVLDSALHECARWLADGVDMSVAINLSARNISEPGVATRVAAALQATGVPASRVILEITESSVLGDPEQTLPILEELNALGVCLSLDDFGTGYSSLSYLQQLPVGEIKIDRSFVVGLGGDNKVSSRALIRSITGLAANLGLRIVAEGIEDEATMTELKELGCHIGQGYHISRPLAAADLVRFVTGFRRQPAALTLLSRSV